MRALLIGLALLFGPVSSEAATRAMNQSPAVLSPPAPSQPASPPAPQKKASRGPSRGTLTITVTDAGGAPQSGVHVKAAGPTDREGDTGEDGTVRFTTLRAGSYRLRFERDGFVTLERDVTLRAGTTDVDVTLTAAPAAPEPEPTPAPPPPPPEPEPLPRGEPKTVPIPSFVEQNFIGREPRKESLLGCTGHATSTLIQIRDPLDDHTHDEADEMIYVVAGEAALRLDGGDQVISPGGFAVIPRGLAHAISRRGRNPVVLLSILAGQPCPDLVSKTTSRK